MCHLNTAHDIEKLGVCGLTRTRKHSSSKATLRSLQDENKHNSGFLFSFFGARCMAGSQSTFREWTWSCVACARSQSVSLILTLPYCCSMSMCNTEHIACLLLVSRNSVRSLKWVAPPCSQGRLLWRHRNVSAVTNTCWLGHLDITRWKGVWDAMTWDT